MTLRRRLLRAAVLLGAFYLLILVLMMALENRLIFHPDPFPGPVASAWQPPGLTVEDAAFSAADGTSLHGWFVPHANARVYVHYAPGNAGNVTYRTDLLRELHRLRAATLIFDYRGYGRSTGSPDEAGILQDARAARAWLAQRANIAPEKIVLLGESLGGGVAVDLATDGAAGLVLLSTFTSLPEVASRVYPFLPVRFLMRSRLDSLSKVSRVTAPLLQAHGDRDDLIPISIGQRLFDAAPDPQKQFITLRGQGHNYHWPQEFLTALDQFFSRVAKSTLP